MKKSKEAILYLIFGGLTTLVNIVSFWVFEKVGLSTAVSTVFAWILSVLFAFFTNKNYVFESKGGNVLKEVLSFFGCRTFTGVLDLGIMVLFVDIFSFPSLLIKIISNVLVIVLNYIFSKFLIFKKGN